MGLVPAYFVFRSGGYGALGEGRVLQNIPGPVNGIASGVSSTSSSGKMGSTR
jgi:hypothetical protein